MRFLLVDDHELTRVGVRMVIATRIGWQVCGEAANGADAIVAVRELKPDVVILDITMPELNGFEVAAEIRRIAPQTKIVFLSLHQVPTAARLAGANEFVSKTASGKDLIEAIDRALGQPHPEMPSQPVHPKIPPAPE